MPAREGLAMKLFGRTLFFLAVFSLCRCGAQDSATTTSPFRPTGLTTSKAILSTTAASTTRGAGNTLTTKTTTAAEDSSGNSTSQTTLIPKESLAPSNGTTGRTVTSKPSPLSESSVTATPNSSLSTTGPSGNTTTRSLVCCNDSLSLMPNTSQSSADSKPEVKNDTGNSEHIQETNSHFSIIIPVVIALIVITLSVFLLVTVYKMCWKTTPERQENGAEQGTSDKENVKLISVKTTSPETGDHSSQGKNKTRQHDDSSLRLGSKCV